MNYEGKSTTLIVAERVMQRQRQLIGGLATALVITFAGGGYWLKSQSDELSQASTSLVKAKKNATEWRNEAMRLETDLESVSKELNNKKAALAAEISRKNAIAVENTRALARLKEARLAHERDSAIRSAIGRKVIPAPAKRS